LTRTAYPGRHYFNKTDSKTRQRRDRSEWVEMASPVIIPPETFDRVQARLEQRRPVNPDYSRCGAKGDGERRLTC